MRGVYWAVATGLAAMLTLWPGTLEAAGDGPPVVSAQAAIVMDARTGAILYEKNAFRQMDPASITKVMTALLVLRTGGLSRRVTISPLAAQTVGSRLHIRSGQRYTVRDLLKGLLMRSGNDAAVALAEAEAGSVTRFVARMNMTAQELGAFNTAFENPNGLTAPGHYSTAYDLALIARAALKNPVFRQIVSSREDRVTELGGRRVRLIHNTNQLLYGFPGADGVKTGTTNAAGKCLAASATRNGQQLISVVLNSPNRWGDSARLLNWGFAHWRTEEAVIPGRALARLSVTGGDPDRVDIVSHRPIWVTVPVAAAAPDRILALPPSLRAPVSVGPVGRVTIIAPDQPARSARLYPAVRVAAKPVPRTIWTWWHRWRHPR